MKRSLLGLAGSVAVLAFAAQPAMAQGEGLPCSGAAVPAGQVCFEYVANGPNSVFPYYDATGQILAPALSGDFFIFCVDETDDSAVPGDEYLAYDTSLSPASGLSASFDGSFPPNHSGANDWMLYDQAAEIVDQWYAAGSPTDETDVASYQWAIWTVMGNGCTDGYNTGNPFCVTATQNLVLGAQALSGTQLQAIADANQWGIITDAGQDCTGRSGAEECQEFLFTAAPPTQVTPEPGTMSLIALGLAGMAGAGMRRRKRR